MTKHHKQGIINIMELTMVIPIEDVVEIPKDEPGYVFVISEYTLKVYKEV